MKVSASKNSARSHPRYEKNPFMKGLYAMKRGKKTVALASKQYGLYDKDTNEAYDSGNIRGFLGVQRIVDKDEFVKIFIGGLSKYLDLSQLAQLVLNYLFHTAKIGEDRIYFSVKDCMKFIERSEVTCYRGLGELLDKEFIAKTDEVNVYFTNVNLFYKGDRYTLFEDVILKGSKSALQEEEKQNKALENQRQMELPNIEQKTDHVIEQKETV